MIGGLKSKWLWLLIAPFALIVGKNAGADCSTNYANVLEWRTKVLTQDPICWFSTSENAYQCLNLRTVNGTTWTSREATPYLVAVARRTGCSAPCGTGWAIQESQMDFAEGETFGETTQTHYDCLLEE